MVYIYRQLRASEPPDEATARDVIEKLFFSDKRYDLGDKVKAGTPLLKVDLDAIRAAGHPTATAIIVTNGDDMGELKMLAEGDVLAGTPLFKF